MGWDYSPFGHFRLRFINILRFVLRFIYILRFILRTITWSMFVVFFLICERHNVTEIVPLIINNHRRHRIDTYIRTQHARTHIQRRSHYCPDGLVLFCFVLFCIFRKGDATQTRLHWSDTHARAHGRKHARTHARSRIVWHAVSLDPDK